MAKETDPSFWKDSRPPESWEDLISYIKPRTPEELTEYFAPPPPSMPDPHEEPHDDPVRKSSTLLEQLRLTEEEFVELALQQPDLWTEEELDYLHLVAAERDVDEHLDELVQAYFSGDRHQSKKSPTAAAPPTALDTSLELPDLNIPSSIPDLEVLEGTVDVDRWWEKQK